MKFMNHEDQSVMKVSKDRVSCLVISSISIYTLTDSGSSVCTLWLKEMTSITQGDLMSPWTI